MTSDSKTARGAKVFEKNAVLRAVEDASPDAMPGSPVAVEMLDDEVDHGRGQEETAHRDRVDREEPERPDARRVSPPRGPPAGEVPPLGGSGSNEVWWTAARTEALLGESPHDPGARCTGSSVSGRTHPSQHRGDL